MTLAAADNLVEANADRTSPGGRPVVPRSLASVLSDSVDQELAAAVPSVRTPLDFPKLVSRCLGDRGFAVRVLETFRGHVSEDLAALEAMFRTANLEGVTDTAHRLKGAAASAGAECFAELAAELERCGRAGRLAEVPDCLFRLKSEWDRVRNYTEALATAGPSADCSR